MWSKIRELENEDTIVKMKNLSEKFVVTKARTNRLAISAIPAMQSRNPINVSSELFKDITEINSLSLSLSLSLSHSLSKDDQF